MNETRINIGQCLLSRILHEKKLQRQELAMKTGISAAQISRYIKNERCMSLKNAYTIAFTLNCTVNELYELKIVRSKN